MFSGFRFSGRLKPRIIRPYVDAAGRDVPGERLAIVALGVVAAFALVAGRLVWLGTQDYEGPRGGTARDSAVSASRPDILDRNGQTIAMDIKMSSMWTDPREIQKPYYTFDRLTEVFPDLPRGRTIKALTAKRASFRWLQREVTPENEAAIMALGLPGIHFMRESRRFYPAGRTAAHVTGHVNVDNKGVAGIERHLDQNGLADLHEFGFAREEKMEPVRLAVDMRVQHVVRDTLADAMARYRAIAATGVVLDVDTGEVVAMASLPDYDPNAPGRAKEHLNRVTKGRFEMGSTFKVFTTAMALDSGRISLNSRFDARKPLRIQRKRIGDFHAKKRVLSTREVFIYSSNIGTVKMAQTVGPTAHRAFLQKIGLIDRIANFEIPETIRPLEPRAA